MSRLPHEPTAQSRQQVRSLSAVGLPQEDIAVIVDCSEKTLRKHYRDDLDEGAADANAAVVGFLMKAINEGNIAAMIFYEKARGGKHETTRELIVDGDPADDIDDEMLPCIGRGPCPRYAADYMPGDEDLPPVGMSKEELAAEYKRVMAMKDSK